MLIKFVSLGLISFVEVVVAVILIEIGTLSGSIYLALMLITDLTRLVAFLSASGVTARDRGSPGNERMSKRRLHPIIRVFNRFMCNPEAKRSGAESESEFREAKVKCTQSHPLL